ncbi:MAG: sel1 repeat family protein [Deltaproteobacteria bacterium]|nr:sel1 repeat family protein [Deltaproteobacteria bacterium]
MRAPGLVLTLVPLLFLAGCPGGRAAKAIQPAPPKAAAADPSMKPPAIEACRTPERHDLMVVDWTPELRGDLEAAMKEGLAVVKFDCVSFKLEPACTLAGGYGYIGTTRREKKIEMNSSDEVAANLPVGGLSWLSDLGAKLGREETLAAQMVMVGKRSSAKKVAERAELTGGCTGTTHFVRAATVGAFVVASGSKAEVGASAKIAGKGASASSKSATQVRSQDGDLDACAKSTPDDKTPPGQCGALVRVELEPIGAAAGAPPVADLVVATCAPGFAIADGACVRPDRPHQCRPGDAKDCAAQCDANDAASCATLAAMYREGSGVAKDWKQAASYADRACKKDVAPACRTLAAAKLGGEGTAKDVAGAIALLDKACLAGDGAGCVDLGVAKLADKKLANDAQYAFRRACYGGGEYEGCAWLGTLYAEGKGGMTASPKLAAQFFEKGCKEGSMRACSGLAELLAAGKGGVDKNAARAKELYGKACDGGYAPACKKRK